jgi:capsule biosynthesis phosphatase
MRICLDLDGVICELRRADQSYEELSPVPGAQEAIRKLKDAGHIIIIQTARHMRTCNGNEGLAVARIGAMTLAWLEAHEIAFDEIYFGKPWADVYVDDNGYRFSEWNGVDVSSLQSREQALSDDGEKLE